MKNKRILIADDHSAIRKGVKQILLSTCKDCYFEEAINYSEVCAKLTSGPWDLLILDIDLQGRSGLDILKEIRHEKTRIPVLIFSFHSEDQIAVRALKSGADGYLSKDSADTELITAIQLLLEGKKYISTTLAAKLAEQLNDPRDIFHDCLSNREYQILLLIASGKTVSEIAESLCLSIPTISTYRARLLEKMKMKTNAELTTYAIRNNLLMFLLIVCSQVLQ